MPPYVNIYSLAYYTFKQETCIKYLIKTRHFLLEAAKTRQQLPLHTESEGQEGNSSHTAEIGCRGQSKAASMKGKNETSLSQVSHWRDEHCRDRGRSRGEACVWLQTLAFRDRLSTGC